MFFTTIALRAYHNNENFLAAEGLLSHPEDYVKPPPGSLYILNTHAMVICQESCIISKLLLHSYSRLKYAWILFKVPTKINPESTTGSYNVQ